MNHYNIWYEISALLGLKTCLALICSSSFFKNNFKITSFADFNNSDTCELINQNIINSGFFKYMKEFAYLNDKIDDISSMEDIELLILTHMTKVHPDFSRMRRLKNLFMINYVDFKPDCLRNLDLYCLSVMFCQAINDVSFMRNLKILSIFETSIDQRGIQGLDLIALVMNHNEKITDVSFMTNLKSLSVCGNCGIGQKEIMNLDLYKLIADFNSRITNVKHMKNLKILSARNNCGIDQAGIAGLNLIEFKYDGNINFRNVYI